MHSTPPGSGTVRSPKLRRTEFGAFRITLDNDHQRYSSFRHFNPMVHGPVRRAFVRDLGLTIRFAIPARNPYLRPMPRKPIELPPEVAPNFIGDMHAYFAAGHDTIKKNGIAAQQLMLCANIAGGETKSFGSPT